MSAPFLHYLLVAIAIILVLEGLLYGLFTDSVRRMLVVALSLPPARLRAFGLGMAALGFLLLLIVPKL
ncbi:MAG: DUF2065 domain-containing protein [Micavibrio aeruginosavorus]|uniref:DUF2065 domain-containing protein n=1 Tax=Micavibrio aeruginosavorus TaxID=349221 RepID=A0A7T5R3C1_9BACT|nr:MAG: DUF2065 domain-containing protein [Micavibrio aeruginosavorus]